MAIFRSETADPEKANQRTAAAGTQAQQNILAGFNTGAYDKAAWAAFNKPLPYPGAIPGSPQDQANQAQQISNQNAYQGYEGNKQFLSAQNNWAGKLALGLSMAALTAGAGAAVAPAVSGAVGGGTTGAIAGGAATGAATGAAGSALTGQNIGKGALMGGLMGGIGAGVRPLVGAATGLTGQTGNIVNSGLSGALTGAAGGAIRGTGALAGAVGGGVSGASAGAGLYSGAASTLGSLAAGAVGGNNVSNGIAAGMGAAGLGSMAMNSGQIGTGLGLGNSLLSTIGQGLDTYGAYEGAQTVGNVLSNTQAGSGIGTNTGFSGPSGTATIKNGQVQTALNSGLNAANTNLGNFAGQQANIASGFNGIVPANVQNAINSQAGRVNNLPQGTQAQLQGQSGLQTAVQGSQLGLMNAGQNSLNNPLTTNLQQAAQNQLGTAGQAFNTTYQNQLAALNQQLALPTQQAEAQMANAQFGRGQLGTTGGALQTQAFAQGLGQAFLGNQQTAYNEALGAQNSAVNNAGVLNNAANSNLNTANGLLANAYGQFNNTSQLNANTANSIFSQNSAINQLGNQYGQQNLNNQVTGSMLPAQLAGAYGQNANLAIQGASGLNNIGLAGANAALGAGTQQGNQYNNAMRNAAVIAMNPNVRTNGLSAIGSAFNNAGSNNLLSGIGSAFNGLFGGGNTIGQPVNTGNPFAGTDLSQGNYGLYSANNGFTGGGDYMGNIQPIDYTGGF